MKKINVATQLVHILGDVGVQRVYGIVGDSLNPITESLHDDGRIQWIHVRHEETAAFAASAEAQITGNLAVCCGSSGPGNLHLINGLYDAHQSHAPVLAIASHIPLTQVGSDYFQETHPEIFYKGCSHYCELISIPSQAPRIVQQSIAAAVGRQGVGVFVLSGDVAQQNAEGQGLVYHQEIFAPKSTQIPEESLLLKLTHLIATHDRIVCFCGIGCQRAQEKVVAFAEKIKAPIAYTFRGKEIMESGNPLSIGMTGLLGWGAAYDALQEAELVIMLGTDFPYPAFLSQKAETLVVQVDINPERIGRRCRVDLGLHGDIGHTIDALNILVAEKNNDVFLKKMLQRHKHLLKTINAYIEKIKGRQIIRPEYLVTVLNQEAQEDAIFTVDTGTPNIWAARYLCATEGRNIIGSFKHGSMACALPMAIGAQCAAPGRQVIAFCGDGGISMGLGELITIVQYQLPIKIIVFNNGCLDFIKIEMQAAGLVPREIDLHNPDFSRVAQSMGMYGQRLEKSSDVETVVKQFLSHSGPALLDVVVDSNALALPPHISFDQSKGFALSLAKQALGGGIEEVWKTLAGNTRLFP